MFREIKINKMYIILAMLFLSSCKDGTMQNEYYQDSIKANELLLEAKRALAENKVEVAMSIIDTIDAKYERQIGVRRNVMKLRPQIKEKIIIKNIQYIDSLFVEYEIQNASAEKVYKARVNKAKYEQQLQVARNQIARMSGDTIL